MKALILYILLTVICFSAEAQSKTDTTIHFKVAGQCLQCKQRIENSLIIRGVRNATWNVQSKLLSVTYRPAEINVDEIHKAVAAAGHDTEKMKAETSVYEKLPACCLYREDNSSVPATVIDSILPANSIRGIVVEKKGDRIEPLPGASISWPGSSGGVISNDHGEFILAGQEEYDEVVVSYAGFETDTISLAGLHDIQVTLTRKGTLAGIVISARVWTTYSSALDPFGAAIMTKKELLKAACCNLSESFETNPSVDISYNDAVTGSKQIQLLGLSGIYTQLTVENLPGPRGIATALGLNSIAGPWIESIQLIKGTGSVVNGFESIAGQINIELRKPDESEKLYANGYVNSMGKTDVNLNWSHKINDKWSTGILLHDDFLLNKKDFNKDGFRDLPTGNQFSGVFRGEYLGGNGLMSQFGFKFLNDDRTGGEISYDPGRDKFSSDKYGLGILTKRYEAFAKIGYVFPEKMHKSIGLQLSAFDHRQDAYFGLTSYDARQNNFYANLIFQSRILSDKHKFKTGLSFLYDQYDEMVNVDQYERKEIVPGAFAEYTFSPNEKLDIVSGLRADHNSLYGWFATPRINVRYAVWKGSVFRLSAGRGQRTANIFAENMGVFVSARNLVIQNPQPGKAYGLQPEVAWNKGISFDQQFTILTRKASIGLDFYHNDFVNQVIVDMENAREIKFYNLNGRSYSNSFQGEFSFMPLKDLDVKLAYRYYDVQVTYDELLQRPLTAKHRGFVNMAYDLDGWKFDYTFNVVGKKRIPSTSQNPAGYKLPPFSPAYVTMNAQVSRSVGKNRMFDLYAGAENLTNYFQPQTIISASGPFSNYFDASLIWGPVTGRMFYAGIRYTIE